MVGRLELTCLAHRAAMAKVLGFNSGEELLEWEEKMDRLRMFERW